MRIKALQAFVHRQFGPLSEGAVREVDEDTGEELVRARLAVQDDAVAEPKRTAHAHPSESPERRKRGKRGE